MRRTRRKKLFGTIPETRMFPGHILSVPAPHAGPPALAFRRSARRVMGMRATVVGLVTPHLLRIVELAVEAEKGVNVDWHLRDAVARTMRELNDQFNAPALVT